MNFIKGFILGLYIVTAFKYLDVNNLIYLSMLCGAPFLFLMLFNKQI
jgi:hypothetical protein